MSTRAIWGVPSVVGGLLTTTLVASAAGSIARPDGTYLITLRRAAAPGMYGARPGHEIGSASPRDVLWGVVQQTSAGRQTAVYEGLVRRATDEMGVAEVVPRPLSERACRGTMSGAGDVHVRIKVFPAADQRPAWIVITPIDVMAWATGSCPSSALRALERAYADRITLEIPLPDGRLAPGRFDTDRDATDLRWTLNVAPASPGRASP